MDTRLAGAFGADENAAAGAPAYRTAGVVGPVSGFADFPPRGLSELAGEITRVTDGAGRRFPPGADHAGAAGGSLP